MSGTVPSGYMQSVSYGATTVDLVLSQPSTATLVVAPTNDMVFTATGTTALLNSQQTDNALLGHLAGQHSGAESDMFQTAFVSFPDTVSSAALAYAGAGQQNDNPLATLPQAMARVGGWFRGMGSFANMSGTAATPSVNTRGGAFLAGVDRSVTSNLTLGITCGYGRTTIKEAAGSGGTIDTTRFAVYGSYAFGAWALDAMFGYAYDRFSNSRPIMSVGEVSSSSHDGHEIDGALQVSRRFDLGGVTMLRVAGVQYVHLYETGFTEASAPGFDLTVSSRKSQSLYPFVGTSFVKPFITSEGTPVTLQADIAYSHELSSMPPSLVQVGSGSFSVDGLTPSRDQLALGGDVTTKMTDRLALYADYQATLPTGNLVQQTVKTGLSYRFCACARGGRSAAGSRV